MSSHPAPENDVNRRSFLKASVGVGAAAAAVSETVSSQSVVAAPKAKSAKVVSIGSRRELFVDEHLIERMTGAARQQLHNPVTRELSLEHDTPWEGTSCGYHSVFQDGDLYRMYYRGAQLTVIDGRLILNQHPEFYCYAESRDGIHWKKPSLGLVKFKGSKKNNIIWEGVGTHNFSPFLDSRPGCPADQKYKALGGTMREGGLFAFASPDAVTWRLLKKEPVINKGAFDSQNLAFWDAEAGCYRAYYRIFTKGITTATVWKPAGVRAIRTATSDDFFNWKDATDLTYEDSPEEQMYTNQVSSYHRAPHILVGFPMRYVERGWNPSMRALPEREHREMRSEAHERYGMGLTEAQVMFSRDGVHFKRWNDAFIPPGPERPDTWNYSHLGMASQPVETKSDLPGAARELSFYGKEGGWTGTSCTLRRYTLRLDGFVSINAPMSGGEMVTRPLRFTGKQLRLNFATSAVGSILVELQRPDGTAVPGFALKDCHEVYGDTVDREVVWKGGSDLSSLQGKAIRFRFVLKSADLYAMRVATA
ncbi:MAG: twin-arginine translocation signal domain-containing protein [Planctomycetota bacterium]|nr:twin-arginine translocation signal domain-containing protein [Planctomycetota bacterium]